MSVDQSDRSKRGHVKHSRETSTSDESVSGAKSSLYVEGKRAMMSHEYPSFHLNVQLKQEKRTKIISPPPNLNPYSEDEVLAFMVDSRMTKNAYRLTRFEAKKKKHRANIIYPSHDRIRLVKERCFPKNIIVIN